MARKPTGNKTGRPKGKWSKKLAKERVKFIIEWRRYRKKYPHLAAQKRKENFIREFNITMEAFEKRLQRTFFNRYCNTDAFLIDDELVVDGYLPVFTEPQIKFSFS
jgi:hypothetical protein